MLMQPNPQKDGPLTVPQNEVERIRSVYADRMRHVDMRRYSIFDPAHLLFHFSRQAAFVRLLKHAGIDSFAAIKMLEIGCGAGDILIECLAWGAEPKHMFGVDVLFEELCKGHYRSVNMGLTCSDGRFLPFPDNSFDLVTQFTVFTSVLTPDVRKQLAAEMLRVVKHSGLIVWYDFWPNNPQNPQVKGIGLREIRTLFQGCRYFTQKIILAPPIARQLAPISSLLYHFLEHIPWLCTHYVVGIFPTSIKLHDQR
jgi:ubiquinone/menaquinone biosynthesis C-methylase UbiE